MSPQRKWVWASILALVGLLVAYNIKLAKEQHPPSDTTGATFRLRKIPKKEPQNPQDPGIKGITFHLHNELANRLNSRRNSQLLEQAPTAFGIEAPFHPLISIEIEGPGNLIIKGNGPTGIITAAAPKGLHILEIYPLFLKEKLLSGYPGEKENLKFFFEPEIGKRSLQAEETLTWSGPNEVFLSSKNLQDVAALIEPRQINQKEKLEIKNTNFPSTTDPQGWLQIFGSSLRQENLAYESEPASQGWQKIRTLEKMREDKAANCFDIAVLTAQQARSAGFSVYLIANSGHALCAVGIPGKPPEEATFFEGTEFLGSKEPPKPKPKPKTKTKTKKQEGKTGNEGEEQEQEPKEPAPNKAPPREKEPEDVFLIDLQKWFPFFQTGTPGSQTEKLD